MEQLLPIILVGLVALAVLGGLGALYQRDVLSSALRRDAEELEAIATARSSLPAAIRQPVHLELAVHLISLEISHAMFISGASNPWSPLQADDVDLEAARRLAASFEDARMAFEQIDIRTSKLAELAFKHAAVHPDRSGLISVVLSEVSTKITMQSIRSSDDELRIAVHHAVGALQGLQDILTPDRLCNPHRPLGHVALNGYLK